MYFPWWKSSLVIAVCVAGFFLALPSFLKEKVTWLPGDTVNLGLDLRGGSYLLLEADFNAYMREQLQTTLEDTRLVLRQNKIGYRNLGIVVNGVNFTLTDINQATVVKDKLREYFGINTEISVDATGFFKISYGDDTIKAMQRNVIEQSIEIVRRRVDEMGTREITLQRQGENRILLQVPGLDSPEQLKRLLGQTAKMTFHLMDENNPFPSQTITAPPGTMLLRSDPGVEKEDGKAIRYYLVKQKVMLSGDMLQDARATFDKGMPVVSFRFNNSGGKKFGQVTSDNVGKPFAIVLDNKVLSAPVIREPIMGGSGIISGNFSTQSANDLALLLRAGALPAPLKVAEERTVGPSLGQDSIEAGIIASLIGIALVVAFMIVNYGLFGLFANLALIVNVVLIIGVLALFHGTLTLPGIAGIVLTIGMAVDANVLIYERIREETRAGKTPYAAIDHGFKLAFSTIFDSNITTLFAALLLYIFGTGPVKGFAVTLTIGIMASMFTAISLTKLMVWVWLRKTKPKTIPM